MNPIEGEPWLKCPTCGYDLRGLPENRCPECGKDFDPVVLKAAYKQPPWPAAQPMSRFFLGLLYLTPACLVLTYAVRSTYDAFERRGSVWHIRSDNWLYYSLALFAPQIVFSVGIFILLKRLRDRLRFAGADNIVGIMGSMLFLVVPLFFIVFMCAGGLSFAY